MALFPIFFSNKTAIQTHIFLQILAVYQPASQPRTSLRKGLEENERREEELSAKLVFRVYVVKRRQQDAPSTTV